MTLPHSRSSPPSGTVGYQDENQIALHIPYVFGSSTPRDLSYLDFLPAKLRVYNTRLATRPGKNEPTLGDYLRQIREELTSSSGTDHRKRDRSVDSAIKHYVFGSSTPRDLSYLERLPWEFRIYDVKLGAISKRNETRSKTTSFSSTGSGSVRQSGGRTSSLNLLDSPSPNGRADHSRRLVRSAHDNPPSTRSNKSDKTIPVSRSRSVTRPMSNISPASSQKPTSAKSKPKQEIRAQNGSGNQKKPAITAPINIQCPESTTSSALPSHELTTFDTSSPTSDEFYVVPSIALKSDTDVGLKEMAPIQNLKEEGTSQENVHTPTTEKHVLFERSHETEQNFDQEIKKNDFDHPQIPHENFDHPQIQEHHEQSQNRDHRFDQPHSPNNGYEQPSQRSPKTETQLHRDQEHQNWTPEELTHDHQSPPQNIYDYDAEDTNGNPKITDTHDHQVQSPQHLDTKFNKLNGNGEIDHSYHIIEDSHKKNHHDIQSPNPLIHEESKNLVGFDIPSKKIPNDSHDLASPQSESSVESQY